MLTGNYYKKYTFIEISSDFAEIMKKKKSETIKKLQNRLLKTEVQK